MLNLLLGLHRDVLIGEVGGGLEVVDVSVFPLSYVVRLVVTYPRSATGEFLEARVVHFVDAALKGYFIGCFSPDLNVTFIVYLLQPFPLFLKDMAFTFIFLSIIGTTSVFPTDLMSPLFGLPPPLKDGVGQSLLYVCTYDRNFLPAALCLASILYQ